MSISWKEAEYLRLVDGENTSRLWKVDGLEGVGSAETEAYLTITPVDRPEREFAVPVELIEPFAQRHSFVDGIVDLHAPQAPEKPVTDVA